MRGKRRYFVLALLVLLIGGAAWWLIDTDPRARIGDHERFIKGQYHGFLAPWATEGRKMHLWGDRADTMWVDVLGFPNNTSIRFVWPPFRPRTGVAGVWGYMGVAHGDYDDGAPEVAVPARRVDQITTLSQQFQWSGDFRLGSADVLTEFYLRSNPAESESKLVEIGWFLHTPEQTRFYVQHGKQIGWYTDADGRRWQVARTDKFVTFMPENGVDVTRGRIDMLAALRWLKGKGVVSGQEWYTGVALGVEPFKGVGKMHIDRWQVAYR